MTTDLWMLVFAALWLQLLIYVPAGMRLRLGGVKYGVGNREVLPEVPAWVGRANRAVANLQENFPIFATAVIVVHLAGKADAMSALGAQVFLAARIAHALLYIGGVIGARTIAYYVGVGATLLILTRLFL